MGKEITFGDLTGRKILNRFDLRMRPALLVVLLFACLAIVSLGLPLGVPRGVAAPADGSLVLEVAHILDEQYVDPVDRVRLLNAALNAMRTALSAAGVVTEVEQIAAGTASVDADRVFSARFEAAGSAAVGKVSTQELAYAAVRGMTGTLNDSHTGFLTPDQNRERKARQRGQAGFTGVGIVLMPKDNRFYVRDVIPSGPAEREGVRKFDRIARVNETPTGGLTVEQVASLIRGPAGTQVTLTLERSGRGSFPVSITRAPIQVPAIFATQMVEPGVGYLHLYQFIGRTSAEVRSALQRLMTQGMRVLVLDLRGNSGGYLHELREMLDLVLPAGLPIYQETARQGRTRVIRTSGRPIVPQDTPIVALVDEGSASAAELLAAALQEHQRGTVVGTTTAGAVEASILIDLSDGSGLSVTILRMSTGKGRRLEGSGLAPQVPVELTTIDVEQGRDSQLQRAFQLARERLARARGGQSQRLPASRNRGAGALRTP